MDELKALGEGERRGIYVHVLHGGTHFYVGLSVDVRSRYLQHLETYGEIEHSSFLAVPEPEDLAPVEMEHIALLRDAGATLLNVLQPDEDMSAEQVAEMFDAEKQEAWLEDMGAYFDGGPKDYDAQDLPKFAKRYSDLLAHKNHSEELLDLLSYFIRTFIPTPDKSEGYLWTLNCLTNAFQKHSARALFRISVHRPEVLTVVVNDKDPEMPSFFIMFTVAQGCVAPEDQESLMAIQDVSMEGVDYKTAKFPHFRINANTMDAAWRLFANPGFVRSMKKSVYELMRSGQTPKNFSQSHCLPLCHNVMSRKPRIPDRVGAAGRATLAEIQADPSLDSVWVGREDYHALIRDLFARSVRGDGPASEALRAHADRNYYRAETFMREVGSSLHADAREMRSQYPEVWRAFYPLTACTSPAIATYAVFSICGFRPVTKADPLVAVRDLLGLIKGAATQEKEGMDEEAIAEDARFDYEGSIVAGILHTCDERVKPLLEEAWPRLSRRAKIQCFNAWPPLASYAYTQFALDRLDESHDDAGLFMAIHANLLHLPEKTFVHRLAGVIFGYGEDTEGAPVTIEEGSGSTYAEYATASLKALKAIAKRESKPKLVPGLIDAWMMWDEEFTAEVEGPRGDDAESQ